MYVERMDSLNRCPVYSVTCPRERGHGTAVERGRTNNVGLYQYGFLRMKCVILEIEQLRYSFFTTEKSLEQLKAPKAILSVDSVGKIGEK